LGAILEEEKLRHTRVANKGKEARRWKTKEQNGAESVE